MCVDAYAFPVSLRPLLWVQRVLSFPLYIQLLFWAFLSDGTLTWRFYVVFNKEKWALYLPAASVVLNARESSYQVGVFPGPGHGSKKTLLPVIVRITVARGWSMFFANSSMTGSFTRSFSVIYL